MKQYFEIVDVLARKIYALNGAEAIEAEVTLDDGTLGRASVPAYCDNADLEAENVNTEIEEAMLGMNALEQTSIDKMLVELDGSDDASRLGKGALMASSLACAKAAAEASGLSLYNYIGGVNAKVIPSVTSDEEGLCDDENVELIRLTDYATLTEVLDAVRAADREGTESVPAYSMNESGDGVLADIAVAIGAERILLGDDCMPIRNELIRIEEELFDAAEHA